MLLTRPTYSFAHQIEVGDYIILEPTSYEVTKIKRTRKGFELSLRSNSRTVESSITIILDRKAMVTTYTP